MPEVEAFSPLRERRDAIGAPFGRPVLLAVARRGLAELRRELAVARELGTLPERFAAGVIPAIPTTPPSATPSAVPDVLAPGLRVVFCGINPGRVSAAAGAHFANPRNDFWRLLHAAGFTPRVLEPHEQHDAPAYGIGLTNAAYRTTKGSSELRRGDFEGGVERLARIAAALRPSWLAFVGKEAYRGTFGERSELGVQERTLDATRLFVLPSTSPANAAVPWDERLYWFRALHELAA